jgi:hypothetical protein
MATSMEIRSWHWNWSRVSRELFDNIVIEALLIMFSYPLSAVICSEYVYLIGIAWKILTWL